MDDRRMQLEQRERVELERDRERLEWLAGEVREYNRQLYGMLCKNDWRKAIDAAMKESE
jgi:hypothetical protein